MENLLTKSIREEVIGMLSIVAGCELVIIGWEFLGYMFIVKGIFENIYAIKIAIKENNN